MLARVRPPLLTEDSVRAAIREVAAGGGRVTGVAVRQLLANRHGARGGVARIYRLIRETQRQLPDIVPSRPAGGPPSDESRDAAIARADLAEHRERIHQQRWARDTDALRRRLAATERGAADGLLAAQRVEDLTRALASAQARIAALEGALAGQQP